MVPAPSWNSGLGCRNEDGSYTELPGGSVFQLFSIPPHGCHKLIPPEANVFSRRKSLPLFGNGLIEAIPEEVLLLRVAANQSHPDGIGGRPHMVVDVATDTTRVGRFGWKAQQATLMSFGAEAYLEEMGITSDRVSRKKWGRALTTHVRRATATRVPILRMRASP